MRNLLIAGVALMGAAGCTAMNSGHDQYADIDAAYVGTVDRVARQAGVEVHWFNPPRKPATTR